MNNRRSLATLTVGASTCALALLLSACGGGGGESTVPPAQAAATLLASIDASQTSAGVGATVDLAAVVANDGGATLTFSWSVDGDPIAGAVGDTAQVTLQGAGAHMAHVEVTATDTAGDFKTAVGEVILVALDPTSPQGLFGESLIALPGDIEEDGLLTLRDAQLLRQHLAGLSPLTGKELLERADFDRDGSVDELDAELLSLAVLGGTEVPSALVPSAGAPGTVVTFFSPALQDPDAHVQVRAGFTQAFEPTRLVLGQVNFFVPLDVLTPGMFTDLGGSTTIDLLVDGVAVESLPWEVQDAPVLPVKPLGDAVALLDALPGLRANLLSDLETFFASADAAELGFDQDDGAIVCALLEQASAAQTNDEVGLRAALEGLTGDEAQVVARLAYANGLGHAFALVSAAALVESQSQALGAGGITALCTVEALAESLGAANEGVGYLCAGLGAVFVGSLAAAPIYPGALAITPEALEAFLACSAGLVAAEIVQLALDLIPNLGDELHLVPSGAVSMEPGESMMITPRVQLTGLDTLCGFGAGLGSDELFEEALAEPLTALVLKKYPLKQVYTQLKKISKEAAESLEEIIEDVVQAVLGATPLTKALGALSDKLCGALLGQVGPFVGVDPNLVALTPAPSVGTVGIAGDQLVYTCPSDPSAVPSGSVLLTGEAYVCSKTLVGELEVFLQSTDVVITMGDNGSALDDIFEVIVNGQSVLTSGVPVVSTSTTVELAKGEHSLQMKGLAAPDGVGTYYINISPGTLVGGPPLSGSNLNAGTVFSWTLVIQ